ncbi:hypothetical protein BDV30DRAFT_209220 [Aspergillus minisclerotigenes]|uniref:Uncharacterized protein n=1 Tax=Aspergillus minisclerotigenes TaxID=656917 RepID=A0A5N6J957_9EURO|nr:hypothetical protein BDV30DRAFT_209220 [Aspergillus minisclerotigenes]
MLGIIKNLKANRRTRLAGNCTGRAFIPSFSSIPLRSRWAMLSRGPPWSLPLILTLCSLMFDVSWIPLYELTLMIG